MNEEIEKFKSILSVWKVTSDFPNSPESIELTEDLLIEQLKEINNLRILVECKLLIEKTEGDIANLLKHINDQIYHALEEAKNVNHLFVYLCKVKFQSPVWYMIKRRIIVMLKE